MYKILFAIEAMFLPPVTRALCTVYPGEMTFFFYVVTIPVIFFSLYTERVRGGGKMIL